MSAYDLPAMHGYAMNRHVSLGDRLRCALYVLEHVEEYAALLAAERADAEEEDPGQCVICGSTATSEQGGLCPDHTYDDGPQPDPALERFAEALHGAMWSLCTLPGMTTLGVHQHTTNEAERAAQREFMRRAVRYAINITGLVPR